MGFRTTQAPRAQFFSVAGHETLGKRCDVAQLLCSQLENGANVTNYLK